MKKYFFLIIASITLCFSCQKENKSNYATEIKIGTGTSSLSEITINRLTERKILLSGGDEKFRVSIEDSKIAQASIHQDTLKIKGLWEGETFANIISHDKTAKLRINVIPQELSISQDNIRLFPQDESKFVSISGGSEVMKMQIDDPYEAIKAIWNGSTGILEIMALHEGDATITLTSTDGSSKTLKVSVRPEGSTNEVGLYTTYRRSYYQALAPKLIVQREGQGIWLSSIANPYGQTDGITGVVAKIPPVGTPTQGEMIDLQIEFGPFVSQLSGINSAIYSFLVEEIRSETIVLSTKRFKLVLPKE